MKYNLSKERADSIREIAERIDAFARKGIDRIMVNLYFAPQAKAIEKLADKSFTLWGNKYFVFGCHLYEVGNDMIFKCHPGWKRNLSVISKQLLGRSRTMSAGG